MYHAPIPIARYAAGRAGVISRQNRLSCLISICSKRSVREHSPASPLPVKIFHMRFNSASFSCCQSFTFECRSSHCFSEYAAIRFLYFFTIQLLSKNTISGPPNTSFTARPHLVTEHVLKSAFLIPFIHAEIGRRNQPTRGTLRRYTARRVVDCLMSNKISVR